MDKLSLLKPIVKVKAQNFINACGARGIPVLVTSTLRTFAEQDALYAQGRTKPGNIVTNAKAGQSFHNWAVAFDVVALKNGVPDWNCDWATLGAIGESCGLEWGGRWDTFTDKPHFQYTAGYTLSDFQNGKIDESRFAVDQKAYLLGIIDMLKKKLAELLRPKQ